MLLIGIEKINYTNKEKKEVRGIKLYYTFHAGEKRNVEGVICDSIYIPEHRAEVIEDIGFIQLGDEFDILYNRFGGVQDIKIINT